MTAPALLIRGFVGSIMGKFNSSIRKYEVPHSNLLTRNTLSFYRILMGTTFMSALWGYWGPFLIAWVLKVLTLRVGGSKTYENYGVPIAAGFVAGYMVAILIGGSLSVIRFFIPF